MLRTDENGISAALRVETPADRMSCLKKKVKIELRDVDFTRRLKISALFVFLQDIASDHAQNLGIGIDRLMEEFGVAWVLMRIRVDATRYPSWGEAVEIETWPQEPKRFEFERDFVVRDSQGEIMIRAVSSWVLLDMATRELKRSDLIDAHYPFKEERAIDCRFGKLKDFGLLTRAYQKTIGYSDIDMNGHLNNARYVDYMMDCFSVENHEKYQIRSIEVNYVNEALPGDGILLMTDTSSLADGRVYIEGIHEKDSRIVFKAMLTISPREEQGL